jgi:hypothetical protein
MIDMTALAGVVEAFATGELSVERAQPVSIVNGRRVDGTFAPISGDSVSVDEFGRSQSNTAEIYCLQELRIADDGATSLPGDRVTHNGVVYEVIAQQNWTRGEFFVYVGRDVGHP